MNLIVLDRALGDAFVSLRISERARGSSFERTIEIDSVASLVLLRRWHDLAMDRLSSLAAMVSCWTLRVKSLGSMRGGLVLNSFID